MFQTDVDGAMLVNIDNQVIHPLMIKKSQLNTR